MEVFFMFIGPAVLFAIIYFAVSLAIKPLYIEKDSPYDEESDDLVTLRDIEILSNDELEQIIKLDEIKDDNKDEYKKYMKYAQILNELKEKSYFAEEEYLNKMDKLKRHFGIN